MLHYATLHYIMLHYTTLRYATQHYTTLHYANYNNYTTLRYTTQPAVVGEAPLQLLQALQKTQLQPPFDPSVDWLCHPCITTTHVFYRVLSLKLPPPPCSVLLVQHLPVSQRHKGSLRHLRLLATYGPCTRSICRAQFRGT